MKLSWKLQFYQFLSIVYPGGGGGGGDFQTEQTGMLVGNFEFNP